MKILSIYFKNINSLQGENRIHFDQVPLSESGVFAITGPNGSGKSSILDVITLALYGETFRFDRPADHVMTKTTAESFAEIEFFLDEQTYRSSWRVQRKNRDSTAALLAPEMSLFHLNGTEQLIADSTQKVRDRVAHLTGMDFHKFSKSMVLAQGDSSAFLNALDSERMDILEKISGTGIYQQHKEQAEEKNADAQKRLQELEQDLNAIPVIDKISREAQEMDLADFKEQHIELKQKDDAVYQQLISIQKISKLESQVDSLGSQQQLIDSQLQENQKKLDKIEAITLTQDFEDDLKTLDNKVAETQQSKKILAAYRSELELFQKQLNIQSDSEQIPPDTNKTLTQQKNYIDQIKLKHDELKSVFQQENALVQSMNQHIVEKKSILEPTEFWLQEHVSDQNLLDNFPDISQLSGLKQEMTEALEKQRIYLNWSKNTTDNLKKAKENSQVLTKKSSGLQAQIAADEQLLKEMTEGYTLDELQDMKIEQQDRIEQFKELNDLASVNAKLSKKGGFAKLFIGKGADREVQELIQESELLQLEIGREQLIISTLEAAVFNEALLLKMQGDRKYLEDGKACPLCGALDHPYLEYPPAVSNSKHILKEQHKKINSLKSDAAGLLKQISAAKKQAEIDRKKDDHLQIITSQWNILANKLNIAGMDLDIDNLSEMKDLLKKEKQELSNLNNLIKKYIKQQDSMAKAESAIELNKKTLERLSKEAEALDLEITDRPDESEEWEQTVSSIQQKVQEMEVKITQQLAVLGEKLPSKKIKQDELEQNLKARKQEYNSRKVHIKTLTDEIQNLETKIATSLLKVEEISRDIERNRDLIQKEEQLDLHLSLLEKQKLIADIELVLVQQENDSATLKESLLENCQDTASGDLNVLRNNVELVKSRSNILQKRLELTQRIKQIWKNQEQTQTELDRAKATQSEDKTEDELLVLSKDIKEKLYIAKQEVESLQNKLNKEELLQEKYDVIIQQLESQKEIAQACEKEVKFITAENGIHFRHKVQQGMADKLMSASNQILEKISGRYYLRKAESEHGLALEIEDTKQKNIRRLPKTLSGGESFLVSLALALALSEMANDGQALDSLFLDEGFGNLDAESLYSAMTTLESLKTHGKLVGVISHVEGVRKRIKTQIKMTKKPNGMSILKVIS